MLGVACFHPCEVDRNFHLSIFAHFCAFRGQLFLRRRLFGHGASGEYSLHIATQDLSRRAGNTLRRKSSRMATKNTTRHEKR